MKKPPPLKILLFWLLAILSALLLAEALLRLGDLTGRFFPPDAGGYPKTAQTAPPPDKSIKSRPIGFNRPEGFPSLPREKFRPPKSEKAAGTIKILCLGDSCTYGYNPEPSSPGLRADYPALLARGLKMRGIKAQVINQGWPGATVEILQSRLPYYLTLHPALTTVYIGWNNLLERPRITALERFSRISRLIRLLALRLGGKYYREVKNYRYSPAFMGELEDLIMRLRASGARPALLTLPGLFILQDPDHEKILVKNCPDLFGNAYTLGLRAKIYNQALRELAAKKQIPLLDLETWSLQALTPRRDYFLDSIHLNARGLQKLADFLASSLPPLLKSPPTPGKQP